MLNLTKIEIEQEINKLIQILQEKEPIKRDGRWIQEQRQLFQLLSIEYPGQWKKMQQFIPTRSSQQIRSHGQKVQKKKKIQRQVKESREMSRKLEKYQEKTGHRATRSRLKDNSNCSLILKHQKKNNMQFQTQKAISKRQKTQLINKRSFAKTEKASQQIKIRFKDALPAKSYLRKFIISQNIHQNNLPIFPNFPLESTQLIPKQTSKEASIKIIQYSQAQ